MNLNGTATPDNPVYKELLDFFTPILALRRAYTDALRSTASPLKIDAEVVANRMRDGTPLLDKTALGCDYTVMKHHFLEMLALIAEKTPPATEEIQAMIEKDAVFESLVRNTLQGLPPDGKHAQTLRFLLEETVNPLLAIQAGFLADTPAFKEWNRGSCPVCGGKPLMGELSGEEGKKFLVCSACRTRWPFGRIQCAGCGTQDHAQVSLLVIEGDPVHSIEICDTCKTYLKIIDCRQAGRKIDIDMENLTTLHLDIIARGKGYTNTHLYMMDA
ncbi:formate dehydrogenase accessory protein FdhE [Desulfosudis oleivorans]|uniref:Uncharacterized protein involved in formate dehydrogenase formation n=1 Tax=Desulfosudis oleivorans (strain DSM 6200 / JCM 39069 / Hxd3) TaxID=96561 RepID=A8ZYN1_DESOH|nr:formate dehydrogenase accessory protein FdhE [Desulfosudis oleivorans]ABW67136.1 uncharacterized protein involved in formate dehydrogenase formation [Desulfosudis oleivorans Hxd3]